MLMEIAQCRHMKGGQALGNSMGTGNYLSQFSLSVCEFGQAMQLGYGFRV
jgi:hypothetical protein